MSVTGPGPRRCRDTSHRMSPSSMYLSGNPWLPRLQIGCADFQAAVAHLLKPRPQYYRPSAAWRIADVRSGQLIREQQQVFASISPGVCRRDNSSSYGYTAYNRPCRAAPKVFGEAAVSHRSRSRRAPIGYWRVGEEQRHHTANASETVADRQRSAARTPTSAARFNRSKFCSYGDRRVAARSGAMPPLWQRIAAQCGRLETLLPTGRT